MDRIEARVELLKMITYSVSRVASAEEIIEMARIFENYVMEPPFQTKPDGYFEGTS